MDGPFQLADNFIDAVVTKTEPAIYLLRRIVETSEYAYYRGYIGRTDANDLSQTLKQWLDSDYRVFWFEYAASESAAFERQCTMWHELNGPDGKLDNQQHPQPNPETQDGQDKRYTGRCPVCSA